MIIGCLRKQLGVMPVSNPHVIKRLKNEKKYYLGQSHRRVQRFLKHRYRAFSYFFLIHNVSYFKFNNKKILLSEKIKYFHF